MCKSMVKTNIAMRKKSSDKWSIKRALLRRLHCKWKPFSSSLYWKEWQGERKP